MGCWVGYSGVGVRVEVCPPCKDPHPRLGYPGYLGIGWCQYMAIRLAYSESLTFNLPTCSGSPVSLCHHLVLAPLVVPTFHPHRQQIETFPQAVKAPFSLHANPHGQRHADRPASADVMATSKLKNIIIPHSIHLTLPPNDHSLVWTS